MEENQKKCKFVKEDGNSCDAWAMQGENFCYLHNPKISDEEKKEAMARGGFANKPTVKEPLEQIAINSPKDALQLISVTLNELRSGLIDTNIAKSIFYGCGVYTKTYEIAVLEEKADALEEKINEKI